MSACPQPAQQDNSYLEQDPAIRQGIWNQFLSVLAPDLDEETRQGLSVYPEVQAYLEAQPRGVDFAQQPDQSDLQIIDDALKSKVGDEIRETCWRIQQP